VAAFLWTGQVFAATTGRLALRRLMAIRLIVAALERLARLHRWQKQSIVFLIDVTMLVISIWLAFSLRLGIWNYWSTGIQRALIGALVIMIPIFYAGGIYRTIFRYAGVGMMKTLVRTFAAYTVGMCIAFGVIGFAGVPRTLGLLQPILFFCLVSSTRMTGRYLMIDLLGRSRFGGTVRNVLVYGAGDAGQQLVSAMRSEPEMQVCGYIDDDRRLDGQRLDGFRVFWSGHLAEAIGQTLATDVLLALPNVTRHRRREIIQELSRFNIRVKILPMAKEIVGDKVSVSDVRPVEVEDLLGREPIAPHQLLLGRTIIDKTVLVTGAGGSIGGELCRQIANLRARRLILFDISEFALYTIETEMKRMRQESSVPVPEIIPILGSVTDPRHVREVFDCYDIDTIYHAAAYKHVPLVEANPLQGMCNNIIGTFEIADAARQAGVENFMLISTDKAVRPTSVMGASKRCAEQIVQAFAARTRSRFSMVRFGNVLGSSGSVVPLFRRQIERGGPITLTHREVSRYFMTIREAANLVIQAAGMAKGGEVFVLDMGKPMKIADLAREMIHLSGLKVRDEQNPNGDIEIVEVGLRPGEKLYEELLIDAGQQKTSHPRIMMAHENFMPWSELEPLLRRLPGGDHAECFEILERIVPEFACRRGYTASLAVS
jgi:FlaA1/EpsC-like NDP-sugar epimerase